VLAGHSPTIVGSLDWLTAPSSPERVDYTELVRLLGRRTRKQPR
jgi:hypothetical protein